MRNKAANKKTMSHHLFGSHHYPPFADMLRFGTVPQLSPKKQGEDNGKRIKKEIEGLF